MTAKKAILVCLGVVAAAILLSTLSHRVAAERQQDALDAFYATPPGQDAGPVYSRSDGTATWEALEEVLGELEGGQALTFSSGMAAISTAWLASRISPMWPGTVETLAAAAASISCWCGRA